MDISAAKARVFPPVGRCIYCGGDGGGTLTKEHIFPAGTWWRPRSATRKLHVLSDGDLDLRVYRHRIGTPLEIELSS